MRRDPLGEAERILVIRPDNIGDVVLTGPLLRSVRAHRPGATIGLLASSAGVAASPLLPWLDEVVQSRPVWQDLGAQLPLDPGRELAFVDALAAGRWDAALILTSFRQTAWPAAYACYLAGIPVRAGFAADFGGSLLTHQVEPPPPELHQALRNLRLLDGLGVPVAGDDLEVRVPDEARRRVRSLLAAAGIDPGDPIVVVPGASAPARRMEPERYGRAAAILAGATGRPVVVAGTPREREALARCVAAAPGAVTLGVDLSVPEFAGLVEAAGVVLCGNSSALHLADALRRPVVAAYSGTDLASQWEPRSTRASLLQVPVACSPCYRIECPIGVACLALDPDDVAHRALALLDDTPRARRARRPEGVACVA